MLAERIVPVSNIHAGRNHLAPGKKDYHKEILEKKAVWIISETGIIPCKAAFRALVPGQAF